MQQLHSPSFIRRARRSGYITLTLFALLVPIQNHAEGTFTIEKFEPDAYPRVNSTGVDTADFQDVSTVFPGVTLSAFRNDGQTPTPANIVQLQSNKVYSRNNVNHSTGEYVFGANVYISGNPNHITGVWNTTNNSPDKPDRNFRADFTTPVSYVYLDVITDNGDSYIVQVFNANNESLGMYTIPGGIYGEKDENGNVLPVKYPIKFSIPNADIKYLKGYNPSGYFGRSVGIDNLQFSQNFVPKNLDPNPDPYVAPPCADVKKDQAVLPVLKLESKLDAYAGSNFNFSAIACGDKSGIALVVPPKKLPKGMTQILPGPVFDLVRNMRKADFTWTPTDKQGNKSYKISFKAKQDKRKGKSSKAKVMQIRVWPATDNPAARGVLLSQVTSAVWDAKKSVLRMSGKLKLSSLLTRAERKDLLKNTVLISNVDTNAPLTAPQNLKSSGRWSIKLPILPGETVPCQIVADFMGKKGTRPVKNCSAN